MWLSVWPGGIPWANFWYYWLTTRALKGCTVRITGRLPIYHQPSQESICIGKENGNWAQNGEKQRCSDEGSVLADTISKGDIDVLRKAWPNKRNLVEIPVSLLDWIRNPVDDIELGEEILMKLKARGLEVMIPHKCS